MTSADAAPAFAAGKLAYLDEAIARSRPMLDWPDGFDGEGSPHYDRATFDRAAAFIKDNAAEFLKECGSLLEAPVIQPGPFGSIDIRWEHGSRYALITVAVDPAAPLAFYLADHLRHGNSMEGTMHADISNHWLLQWLRS